MSPFDDAYQAIAGKSVETTIAEQKTLAVY